ncbi:hypothetical protein NEOLEDRAFT_1173883 [Neolentinus lepideus HHB14362 ss-1]|uniref:GRIP domain-containing protein n=1 Tax=Neolentinus lepideus HHB14362 ss-1 TaxID=1314782 RepID=A0A165W019_9AGAM|nr:hypothetical protein NEOLEDRAFT_1173883 [Neolentinus lepideus HHB14362 ss-1]
MFSQFRQAVENLAQPVRRSSQDFNDEEHRRSSSLDTQSLRQSLSLPSGQLAESALENLRKSLTSQRAGAGATSPPPGNQPPRRRPNLEERLKATFIVGDVSNSTSPSSGTRVSTPVPVSNHTTSPGSTPLPDSPSHSPRSSLDIRQDDAAAAPPSTSIAFSTSEPSPVPKEDAFVHGLTEAQYEDRFPEADVPLPSDSPVPDTTQEEHKPAEELPSTEIEQLLSSGVHSDDGEVAVTELLSEGEPVETTVPSETTTNGVEVDSLRERLKLVEQRFAGGLRYMQWGYYWLFIQEYTDVSTSFKRLQTEKLAADRVLKEFTPLESLKDAEDLRDFLQNNKSQAEMAQAEIRRLNGSIARQDERLQELRDTHRLESASQIDLIDQLRKQLTETETLLKASQNSNSTLEENLTSRRAEVTQLQAEVEKINTSVKEEEEKRVKAVSLLKTVRQKLVKAEKDREDAVKEVTQLQAREKEEKERAEAEKKKLREQIEEANAERERALNGLKSQFDREVALLKDRQEKDINALRGQFELESVTARSLYEQELSRKIATISSLENTVQTLRSEKDHFFDQLQMRQAEVESTQGQLEILQNQNTEYQYQLRELNERIGLLNEELAEARREQDIRARGTFTSAEEVAQLLSSTEAKYESRISDLRRTVAALEKERDESESDWSRKLREKSKEIEALKKIVDSSSRSRDERAGVEDNLKAEAVRLKIEVTSYQKQIAQLQKAVEKTEEAEDADRQRVRELQTQISVLQKQVEEFTGREAQLRASNKTLREELRKVQSSAALLEKQRNPGVGYWSSRQEDGRRSTTSLSETNGSRPSSRGVPTDDEEVNLEYLRNVVLQFLEHKEMRPQLVRVLSTILRFTPQETRRLVAKV